MIEQARSILGGGPRCRVDKSFSLQQGTKGNIHPSYASCLKKILKDGDRFTEVFSGPNAPLSQAVCRECNLELPGHRTDTMKGVKEELHRLAQVVTGPSPIPSFGSVTKPTRRSAPESTPSRVQTLETQRQPSGRTKFY